MDDGIVAATIVMVVIFLALTGIFAYIIKRFVARHVQRIAKPSRTIPAKERPDELSTPRQNYMPEVKGSEQKDIEEPLNWFEKERFHQDIREFLKQSDPPK